MQIHKNKSFFPMVSLIFNIVAMLAVTDTISSITDIKTISVIDLLYAIPSLLMGFGFIMGPWLVAINLSKSQSSSQLIYINIFSIITIITCFMIVGFIEDGRGEVNSYNILSQIIIAWITLGICKLFKTKSKK